MEDLYASDAAWLEDLEKLKTLGAKLPEYDGKLSASAQTLLEYQKLGEEISVLLDSLANYAQRKSDEDTRNAVYQDPVSYTHLDVYKRQQWGSEASFLILTEPVVPRRKPMRP